MEEAGSVVDCALSAVAMFVLEFLRLATFFGSGWWAAGCSLFSARLFVCERVLADLKRSLDQRYSAEYTNGALTVRQETREAPF